MSGGIHTGAPFALLDLRTKGVDMDTYDVWPELAGQALYLHAVQARGPDAAKGTKYGEGAPVDSPDSAYCDAYLARLDKLVAEVRQRVIESWDPARLRAPEVWPFCMADSTLRIHADRWYAFGDSGGTFSGHDVDHLHPDMLVGGGFASLAACRDAYEVEHGEPLTADDWSAEPEHLGGVLASILTGRQYVDRLYHLTEHDAHECTLEPYGHWSEAPAEKHASDRLRVVVEVPAHPEIGAVDLKEAMRCALKGYTGSVLTSTGGAKLSPTRPAITSLLNRAEVL